MAFTLRRRLASVERRRAPSRRAHRPFRMDSAERALLTGFGMAYAIMEGNEHMPDLLDDRVPYERAIAELAARIAIDNLTEQDRRTLATVGAALEAQGRTITAKQYVALKAEVQAMF